MKQTGLVSAILQLTVLVVVLYMAHYLYKIEPDHEARAWAQFRYRGIEGTILWAFACDRSRRWPGLLGWIGPLVCFWGMYQEAETFACSFGGVVSIPLGKGLCTARYGAWPSWIAFSGATAWLIVWRLKKWTLNRILGQSPPPQ